MKLFIAIHYENKGKMKLAGRMSSTKVANRLAYEDVREKKTSGWSQRKRERCYHIAASYYIAMLSALLVRRRQEIIFPGYVDVDDFEIYV